MRGLQINLLQFVAIYHGMGIRPATPPSPDRGTIVTQQTRPVAVFYKLNTIIQRILYNLTKVLTIHLREKVAYKITI